MSQATRVAGVVRPHRHGPFVVVLAFWSAFFGALGAATTGFLTKVMGVWPPLAATTPLLSVLMLVLTFLLLRQRRCPHTWWTVLYGGVGFAATVFGHLIGFVYSGEGSLTDPGFIAGFIAFIALSGLLGALLTAGIVLAMRLFHGTSLVQTGRLCPRCGYDIRGLPQRRCPECGRPFTDAELEVGLADGRRDWLRASAPPIAVVGLVCILCLSIPHLVILGWVPWPWAICLLEELPNRSSPIAVAYLDSRNALVRKRVADVIDFYWLDENWEGEERRELLARLKAMCRRDPSATVRFAAVAALGTVGGRSELCEILPFLAQEPDPQVRWCALSRAAAGANFLAPEVTPYLIAALDDSDASIRCSAYTRLCGGTGQRFPFDSNAPRDKRLREQAAWQEWWRARGEK